MLGALILAALALPGVAGAAPLRAAQRPAKRRPALGSLPASVPGTTVGATTEGLAEPPTRCGPTAGSVWYALTASADGRLAVSAQAAGDLDLVVDVLRRVRSQNVFVACDVSDERGAAATDFAAIKGSTYLVRVSPRINSVPGTFSLTSPHRSPLGRAPGAELPHAGPPAACHASRTPTTPGRSSCIRARPTASTSPAAGAAAPCRARCGPRRRALRRRPPSPALRRLSALHAERRRGRALLDPRARVGLPAHGAALPPPGRRGRSRRHRPGAGHRQPRASAAASRAAGSTSSTSIAST